MDISCQLHALADVFLGKEPPVHWTADWLTSVDVVEKNKSCRAGKLTLILWVIKIINVLEKQTYACCYIEFF